MRNLFHKSGIIVFLILSQILFSQPTTAPDAPAASVQDVVSIYSDAYTDVPAVWNPNWGTNTTVVEDVVIANNNVKKYTLFNFSGLDFGAAVGGGTIDASFRTHIRLDYWTEDATSIKIKLVDYGADNVWGNDNVSGISTSNVLTNNLGTWTSIDIDLNEMALGGLTTRANIGQMVLEATVAEGAAAPTVYFDNIYFFGAPPTSPLTVPPAPTIAAADVISIYSDSYTDIATNYGPNWGTNTTVVNPTYNPVSTDTDNNVLAYTNFNYQGTELTATDASSMDFLHIDVWVAAGTDRLLKVSPINNATGGTGAGQVLVNVPLTPGAWNSIDIPKSDFAGMTWDNVFQFKFDGQFNGDGSANAAGYDVYLDNIYFGKNANTSLVPLTVPPAPTIAAADVISIYSDSYTDIATNYGPNWGTNTTVVNPTYNPVSNDTDNNVLAYTNFNYQGTELTATDASSMDFLHIDVWVAAGTDRLLKVSPINNATGGTGAGQVLVNVPLTPGAWNSIDIPKSDFAGMTWDNVFQFKFDGQFNGDGSANAAGYDVYLDNIYFFNAPLNSPLTVPPAPTMAAADVISIYSDSYTDIATNYNPAWQQSGAVNTTYLTAGDAANNVLVYTNFNYQGTETSTTDASSMDFLHIDVWVASGTDRLLKVTPVNTGGTGTNDILVNVPLTPGAWNSVNIPKSDFTGMTWDNIIQLKFDGQFNGDGSANAAGYDVYLDNIYFGKNANTSLVPLTVPPAPTIAAADVISIYSDSYTDIATNYGPNWGTNTTVVNPTYNPVSTDTDNNVLAYTNFNYQGTELTATDASSMDFLHIDVWVAAGTDRLLKVSPINNATGGTGAGQVLVNVPLTPGAWNSIDIPKSDFAGMTWDNVFQFKFDGQFNGDGSANTTGYDVYLDNIYFWDVYVPDAPVVIHDFNSPEGATSVASGGEWTQFDETDNTANYISLAQLSAADAPGVDSPVMSADYGVIGMIDANGESQWGGYTAMQDKFETVQDLTGYTHLSFKFYNNMPPTGSVGDSLELRVVLWDVSNVSGDYATRADVETWYAFFKTGIGESPFQNATADGWVEYKIPLLNNGSTGDNMGYRNGFSFPGVGWGISQAGNSQLDLDKIGGMHFELVIVGDGETAQGNFLIEDIQAIYSNEIPGCMNMTSCNYNPEATVDDGSCYDCVDVTFNLDMKNVIGYTENDQPYLAGGTFGAPGSPDAALTYNADLSQNGHLVFSKVVQFRENQTFTYTYSKNNDPNWGGKENIADQDCAVGTFNDRSLTTTSADSVINACYGNCTDNAFCPAVSIVDVTFSVNMADVPNHLAPTIAGPSFPAPGITMTDADNDSVYVATVQKNEGELLIYKFANGPVPNFDLAPWETVPSECGPGPYGERNYTVPMSVANAAVDTVCFSSCTNCIEDYPVDVTFNLDMRGVEGFDGSQTPYVFGSYQQWNPQGGDLLTDTDGDTIYSGTVSGFMFQDSVTILFGYGSVTEVVPATCSIEDASLTMNVRELPLRDAEGLPALVLPAVGFGKCPVDLSVPSSVPPTPTLAAADVMSIFSDAYTNIATNYDPSWGQSGQVNTTFDPVGDAVNHVLAYTNFDFQGTEMIATDASAMDYLHIDIWVELGTDRMVKVTPVNNNAAGGTGVVDILVNVPLTPGAWNSVDIPLSDFTGMTCDNVHQIKFDGKFNGDGSAQTAGFDIYLDNIYFWKDMTTASNEVNDLLPTEFSSKAYPNPFNPYVNISYALPTTENVKIDIVNLLGQNVKTLVNTMQTPGSYTYRWNGKDENGIDLNSGMYFAIINRESGRNILKITYLK